MSKLWRKPDQTIQPYYFGDQFQKTTHLWLKGLPKLIHIPETDLFNSKTHVYRGDMVEFKSGRRMPEWYAGLRSCKPEERASMRAKTFPGIADAMAEQWGALS